MSSPRLALLPCLAILLGALLTPPVFAIPSEKAQSHRFVDISRQESFEEQAASVRDEMRKGGRFEFLKGKQRREVDKQLDLIAKVLERRAGQLLDDEDQLEIFAAQETANAILTENDGRRMICENTPPIGSKVKELQCATLADRERAHRETRRMMRENIDKGQLGNPGN
jgi:hypothetical protein